MPRMPPECPDRIGKTVKNYRFAKPAIPEVAHVWSGPAAKKAAAGAALNVGG